MEKFGVTWQSLLPLLVTILVAIGGWVVGHRLNAERDLHNKRVELRTRYLLDAYRGLEASIEQEVSRENLNLLETAIADIQLLGTPEQIDKVIAWAAQFKGEGTVNDVNLQDLLEDLRKGLRKELGLVAIEQQIRHIKFSLASETND